MMSRSICIVCASFLVVGWLHGASSDKPKRPNILLIYADDQSYKTIGCYPEALPGVKTPNIDGLAASGIRFHGAFLGAWCMPSRASMLTGRWPHGVESMRMEGKYPASAYDPQQCPFWPKVFREHGYTTAQIGKWHTGVDAGTGRDWDWQIVWNRPLHPENAGRYYDKQILSFNGEERMTDGYSTDNYTRWACDYIKGGHRDATKPWYLWLCYGAIHGPTTPAERHKGLHKNDEVRVPADILPPREGKPGYLDKTQAWTRDPDREIRAGKSGETFGNEAGKKESSLFWVGNAGGGAEDRKRPVPTFRGGTAFPSKPHNYGLPMGIRGERGHGAEPSVLAASRSLTLSGLPGGLPIPTRNSEASEEEADFPGLRPPGERMR